MPPIKNLPVTKLLFQIEELEEQNKNLRKRLEHLLDEFKLRRKMMRENFDRLQAWLETGREVRTKFMTDENTVFMDIQYASMALQDWEDQAKRRKMEREEDPEIKDAIKRVRSSGDDDSKEGERKDQKECK